jgi:hypothetical protein
MKTIRAEDKNVDAEANGASEARTAGQDGERDARLVFLTDLELKSSMSTHVGGIF